MAILANRVKEKNSILGLSKVLLFYIKRFFVVSLIVFSCYLLYFSYSKVLSSRVLEVVGHGMYIGSSICSKIIDVAKSSYFQFLFFKDLQSENLKLRLEVENLAMKNHSQSILRAENTALREILNVTSGIENRCITAEVVGTSVTPFANSIIIKAGEKDKIKVNDLVKGKQGLVGRIIEVSKNYSTVMLISDHNSRIPVFTENSKTKGILAKQGDNLKLIYLDKNHDLSVGEKVYTSGDGRIFTPNIPVGIVVKIIDSEVFVKPIEDFSKFDFVVVESVFESVDE